MFKEVSGKYSLKSNCGQQHEKVSLEEHIKQMIDIGIGEIFCNSINNDGMMQGYDIELVKTLSSISSVPVIICGGAGNFFRAHVLYTTCIGSTVSALRGAQLPSALFVFPAQGPVTP